MSETYRFRYTSLYGHKLERAHSDDACFDLIAAWYSRIANLDTQFASFVINPQQRVLARTGIRLELRPGWEAEVRPRSGNALKLGLTVANTPGTIDAGYRNEVGVILLNTSDKPIQLTPGMRVAQLGVRKVPLVEMDLVESLDEDTERGQNGYGSTGI